MAWSRGAREAGGRAKSLGALGSYKYLVLVIPVAALLSGCRCGSLEKQWRTSVARQTLECLHSTGIYDSTGDVACSCNGDTCEIRASLLWRGRATDSNYITKVSVRVSSGLGTVYVLEDTAIVPAATSCRIPIQGP